ncbi:MAG: hypothetical protein ACUVXA_18105 [Candidatus Jordarchaeum sp.]|uniref:hypothetical protein n=1 Tax=Candidatus Jordarchaeum sp. TaxID=2823881 RepID=UPI00404B3318
MDIYWLLFNPMMYELLNIIFGFILILGLGLFIYNIILLITYYRKRQVIPRLILSLILIGMTVRWELILPAVSEIMGGVVQYYGTFMLYLIYQWLAQHGIPMTLFLL